MSDQIDAGPCTLVRWSHSHLDELVVLADDARVADNLTDRFPHPYTRAAGRAWIESCLAEDPAVNFAIVEEGRVAGGAGLTTFGGEEIGGAEVGYWIGADHWGRGLATAALAALTDHGFGELGLRRIQAGVFSWNPASVRVLEKVGYRLEGRHRERICKQGRIGDMLMYARLRSDPSPGLC
jgi:ribosomal-protein-alanine N-acetyltransferase